MRSLPFALIAVALGLATPAFGNSARCVASAEVIPSEAIVGQQVLWRVRIETTADVSEVGWISPPSFANVRTERLPGKPATVVDRAEGGRTRSREEHRALFPEAPGSLTIETAGLSCTARGGEREVFAVPDVQLVVREPPESGRPAEFEGVIGPLVVQTHVESERISLGETIRAIVSIRGSGNLWDVRAPLVAEQFANAELFARPPLLDLRPGTRLSVQRVFHFDVVARRAGELVIPAVRLAYYDPQLGAYAWAETPPKRIVIDPDMPSVVDPPVRLRDETAPQPGRSDANSGIRILAAALGAAVIALAALGWRRARGQPAGARTHLAAAARAAASGDRELESSELARALRAALGAQLKGVSLEAGSLPPADDFEPPVAPALRALEALERARFGAGTPAPDSAAVRRVIESLQLLA